MYTGISVLRNICLVCFIVKMASVSEDMANRFSILETGVGIVRGVTLRHRVS